MKKNFQKRERTKNVLRKNIKIINKSRKRNKERKNIKMERKNEKC